jgi:myo-inositol 2-dehydrogenase/D-chiro-inositol 1-dehydrogenase
MDSKRVVRFALIGAGRIGSIRAEILNRNPRSKIEYIVDSNLEFAEKLANVYHAKVSDKLETILNEIDAVWISSPTHLHPHFIEIAALAKKAVATEKPVAFTDEDITKCFRLCEENKAPFLVGFQRRCDPHFSSFKQSLDKHGPAHILRIVNRDHPLPHADQFAHLGSIWDDFLIHDFDTTVWLLNGQVPERIYATGSQMLSGTKGTDVLDTALVNIYFASGTHVSIEASRYSPAGYDQRLEAITSTATILANNPARTEVIVAETDKVVHDIYNYSFPQRYYEAYRSEVDYFIRMILDGEPAKVTLKDCLLVSKIIKLADQSHREKKAICF